MTPTAPAITLAVLYPNKWSKFTADADISPALLNEFAMSLDGCADSDELMKKAEGFCRNHQMHGKEINPVPFAVGRVCVQIRFEELLTKYLRLRPDDTRQLLAQIAGQIPAQKINTVKFVLGTVPMGNFLLWVFRNPPDDSHPFSGINVPQLPCRLGLKHTLGEQFIGWGIGIPAGHSLRSPTGFDAGIAYVDDWAPGGNTVPQGSCTALGSSGFPEFVLRPLLFEHVSTDLLQFSAI